MFLAEQPGRIHSPDLQVTSVLDQPRAYDGASPPAGNSVYHPHRSKRGNGP